MKIIAKDGIDIVSRRVNECRSLGEETIKELIYHAEVRAWRTDKYKGNLRTMVVKVYENRFILPDEWNVLMAVNIGRHNHTIRKYWYEFDKFGPGTVTEFHGQDIYTNDQVLQLEDVCTPWPVAQDERIAIYSSRREAEGCFLTVQGRNQYDKEIFTARNRSVEGEVQQINDVGEDIYFRTDQASLSDNRFLHDGITSLMKPITNGEVTIVAYSQTGATRIIGEMGPGQRQSFLSSYRLPGPCSSACVYALVKRSEPGHITHDNQILQIESEEALVFLTISAYYDLQAYDPAKSEIYFNKGIKALNGQLSQTKGGSQQNIRMDGMAPIDRRRHPYIM